MKYAFAPVARTDTTFTLEYVPHDAATWDQGQHNSGTVSVHRTNGQMIIACALDAVPHFDADDIVSIRMYFNDSEWE